MLLAGKRRDSCCWRRKKGFWTINRLVNSIGGNSQKKNWKPKRFMLARRLFCCCATGNVNKWEHRFVSRLLPQQSTPRFRCIEPHDPTAPTISLTQELINRNRKLPIGPPYTLLELWLYRPLRCNSYSLCDPFATVWVIPSHPNLPKSVSCKCTDWSSE